MSESTEVNKKSGLDPTAGKLELELEERKWGDES
jgi:hypothetical protein